MPIINGPYMYIIADIYDLYILWDNQLYINGWHEYTEKVLPKLINIGKYQITLQIMDIDGNASKPCASKMLKNHKKMFQNNLATECLPLLFLPFW